MKFTNRCGKETRFAYVACVAIGLDSTNAYASWFTIFIDVLLKHFACFIFCFHEVCYGKAGVRIGEVDGVFISFKALYRNWSLDVGKDQFAPRRGEGA